MNITLPDGSIRKLKEGSTGLDLAMDIGPGLAKAAIAVTVNGDQKDLCDPIEGDAKVSIITVDSSEGHLFYLNLTQVYGIGLNTIVFSHVIKEYLYFCSYTCALGPSSLAPYRRLGFLVSFQRLQLD